MWKKWFQTVDTSTEKFQQLKERLGLANEFSGFLFPPPHQLSGDAHITLRVVVITSSRSLERKIEGQVACIAWKKVTTTTSNIDFPTKTNTGNSGRLVFCPRGLNIDKRRRNLQIGASHHRPTSPPKTLPNLLTRSSSDTRTHLIPPADKHTPTREQQHHVNVQQNNDKMPPYHPTRPREDTR